MRLLLPLLLLTILARNSCDGLRILALFPLNGKSHWVMAEGLLTGLAKQGHQVDVVTHFPLKKPPANYREISLAGTIDNVVNNMSASSILQIQKQDMSYMVTIAGNRVCDLLRLPQLQELIKRDSKSPQYDVIIVELFVAPCYLAFGRLLKAPVIGVMTSSFQDWISTFVGSPHNPSFMPGLFSPFGGRMTFWQRLMNTYLSAVITTQINYYMSKQTDYVKKYLDMDVAVEELYQDVAAILVNSHHSINGVKPFPQGIIEVGGLHVKNEADPLTPELQKWLDDSKDGCIFFTFGSMVRIETFPKPLLETFYKVFEKIAPVRVLMKVAKPEDLLPGLPKNVMIQPWFSQTSVFKHKNLKAFITHGGLMGTMEAIYYGIPMVGIPLFGDQSTNLANAASQKIAVSLNSVENVTEETLSAAINTVLYDETHRNSMKKISHLFKDRPMSAIDTAVYWVEYVARNGYVLQSPGIHLAWYQQYLLDIYTFLIACLGIILYIAIRVIKSVKNLFATPNADKNQRSSESKKRK